MLEHNFPPPPLSIAEDEFLEDGEVIVIVDDFPDIVSLLQDFLEQQGFSSVTAESAATLHQQLATHKVALVLLDIGLPDADGMKLLPELKERDPDLAVIMLTAVTDLQTALACLRYGADDYLAKPVHFTDLLATLRRVLEKRRLSIRNRQYQRQIEQANYRIGLAHRLAMKMNSAYLSMTELDEILLAILVGITADEGLRFNRAFLALFDEAGEYLEGRLAIGPGNREDGSRIWQDIRNQELGLSDLFARIQRNETTVDAEVNRIVRALRVDAADREHLLIRAVRNRESILVEGGEAICPVPLELIGLLQEDSFVVIPLYSPSRSLGVIIADHFVNRSPIDEERIRALESFAGQASLAIEHCRLYVDMQHKIKELESATQELEKNKDLLIEAERYSALGHMAAQLAHSIRNPITAIGGTARLLARKIDNKELLRFLAMMAGEAEKIEKTLEDLFSFVEQVKPELERTHLFPLIHKSLLLHFNALKEQGIKQIMLLPEVDPLVEVDPRLIQQALVHLIRNSVEAMPEGGELMIEVELVEEEVRIILRDSGHGLGESHGDHATDPFYTTKMVGTGMGLTLVKRIVEDHGGRLSLDNRSEGGTRATVVLPRIVEE
ncbi:MAG: response regulator [Desulfobulbus sp.]|nr:response regulator [Desulfobulbus sp.]